VSCEDRVNGGGGSTAAVVDRGSQPHNVLGEWSHSLVGAPRPWSRAVLAGIGHRRSEFLADIGGAQLVSPHFMDTHLHRPVAGNYPSPVFVVVSPSYITGRIRA
jgi:hypothetical protein